MHLTTHQRVAGKTRSSTLVLGVVRLKRSLSTDADIPVTSFLNPRPGLCDQYLSVQDIAYDRSLPSPIPDINGDFPWAFFVERPLGGFDDAIPP